jgi:hypothetical protein
MKIYSVTEVLGKYFDWSSIPEDVLANACKRGSAVHVACGSYAKLGYAIRLPDEWVGYFNSFIKWYESNVAECLLVEERFTDNDLGFTGRQDFIFRMKTDEVVLTDIKTPLAEQPTWKCQLAAYDHLATKIGGFKLDDILSLRLHPDGGPAKGIRYKGSRAAAFNAFLSALNAHRYING